MQCKRAHSIRRKKEYNSIKKYYSLFISAISCSHRSSNRGWDRYIKLDTHSVATSISITTGAGAGASTGSVSHHMPASEICYTLAEVSNEYKNEDQKANYFRKFFDTKTVKKEKKKKRRRWNVINAGKLKSKNISLSLSPPPHTQITWASVTWPSIGTRKGVGRYVQRYREWRGSFQ